MIRVNENYLKLQASWLFSEIAKKVSTFQSANPDMEIIKLGIGDVTRSLPRACINAFHHAVDEMADDTTFRGYGPDQGYEFLRQEIAENDFQARGADISPDEIFISDGAKCDAGNIQEIFAAQTRVALPDPVYPVYLDSNVMAGRTGGFKNNRYENMIYLESTRENGFIPDLPTWVDFARESKALILYDAAYEAFIRDDSLPKSIYEIEGARQIAIEFRSFSKTAGFTGTRCAFTVIPKSCQAFTGNGARHPLHPLWLRRQTTKFNGVSYPVQRAAEAVYSAEGQKQCRELTDYYLRNAALILKEITALGFECIGGVNSPYIWIDCKSDSWEFFDLLLEKAGVVCTPGTGFGQCGDGYIRISAFNNFENIQRAMSRISQILK
jgi:LL-diaminopimelate aminotransferase